MSLARSARYPALLVAVYAAMAVACVLLGLWVMAVSLGVFSVAAAITALVIHQKEHHERKSHGRYRKAPEAHRAGAGGSARNSARDRARARRDAARAGASMSGVSSLRPCTCSACMSMRSGIPSSVVPVPSIAGPRPAGEFDGKQAEFAPGVVTGTRSFEVDKLGRLLGVAYKAVWTPGENEAKCMERGNLFASLYDLDDRPQVRESTRPPHSIAECAHGFYGYYEGSNDYYEPGRVMGVIEAYGETIIGSRGFRASKARIVALHIPSEIPVGRRRLVARNYPGLAIFDSFDAMVSEFPPDDSGHGLNPSTDPEFWTRSA